MRIKLKGLNRTVKRLADGREVTYWYAWRGGPRLEGRAGSPEFVASYTAAVAARRAAPTAGTLSGLVVAYKQTPEFTTLDGSTRAEWMRWLDRIMSHPIGELPVRLLEDRRIREDLIGWRDEYADRPRTADYGVQVLRRVLAVAKDRGKLTADHAEGIGALYEGGRGDQVWAAAEIAAYVAAAPSAEVGFIVRLACLTGLRREDLATLTDSHVGDVAIVKPTGKSRGRKVAIVPLLDETRQLLAEIRAQRSRRHAELCAVAARKGRPAPPIAATLLTNTRGRPWSVDGLEHMVVDTKARAGVDKHLHDGRGTFATRLRQAGLTASEIADVLGWEEERVERLLAAYVDRDSIVLSIAERIRQRESGPA